MASSSQRRTIDFRQEFLTCSICANPFDKQDRVPKCLPCLHCFCNTCLRHHVAGRSNINCPTCRKLCIVPENGVDGFVTNFNIENLKDYQHLHEIGKGDNVDKQLCTNCDIGDVATGYCHECTEYVCQQCASDHLKSRLRQVRSHKIETLEDAQNKTKIGERHVSEQYCQVHTKNKKALSVFCETCQKPVCDTCGLTDHKNHDLQDLEKSIKQTIDNLKELSGKLKGKSTPLEQLTGILDSKMEEITTLRSQREREIDDCFDNFDATLRGRRQRSKEELDELCKRMTKDLREQKVDVEDLISRFMSAVDFVEHTCKYANPVELFQHRNMVTQQINDLIETETREPRFTQPLANSVFVFTNGHITFTQMFDQAIPDVGSMRTSSTIASCCYVEGLPRKSLIHTPQTIVIYAMDGSNKQQTEGGDHVIVNLKTPEGAIKDCPVNDSQDGRYTTSFTPEDTGQFYLEIHVFGRAIKGSPFQLNVKQDIVVPEPGFAVVQYPLVALVGHSHEISIDLSKNSDEARADRLQCEVMTQTGDKVSCEVKGHGEGRFSALYIPPIEGSLSLSINLNGVPLPDSPYTINVSPASPKATRVHFEKPIVNQKWAIKISSRDYRQQKMDVPVDVLAVIITDLSTQSKRTFTPTKCDDGDSYVVHLVPTTGPYVVSVLLHNIRAFEENVEVKKHLAFTFQQNFPTGITSGGIQNDLIYSSDTMDGKLYAMTLTGTVEYSISSPKTAETSQIAVDNQGRLVLLFPKSKSVHFVDQQGNEIKQWHCQKRNSRPVTLTSTKDGRIVIADSKEPSMFIYKSDGTCITKETLPPKSIVDGVNNICVDSINRIMLAHHTDPNIRLYDSDGKPIRQFESGATSVQLAAAVTADNLLLVSQLGQVRVFRIELDSQDFLYAIPIAEGHIYMSLAAANDGSFIGLDVGQKQIVKYGYAVSSSYSTE